MFARILISLVLACGFGAGTALATDYPSVEVVDAYLDLRTGPGRGYPKVQIVERVYYIESIARKTDWFRVCS